MRKIVLLLLVPLMLFSVSNLVNAEVTEEAKVKKDAYATTEDILITMIEPELNKIITEKYGEEKTWQIGRVMKVSLIADHTKETSEFCYEMIMGVKVNDDINEKELSDSIHIKIDIPNMYTRDKYKKRNTNMKVSLVKYEQWR